MFEKKPNMTRAGGTGCAGCAIAHPLFEMVAIETSFKQKKKLKIGPKLTELEAKM